MFKKICATFLALTMIFAFSACGSSQQHSEEAQPEESGNKEPVTGGWELHDNEANALPEDVQAAFDKATEKFTGSELEPVAYIASQVVAGTNYIILCEATTTTEKPERSYQMVIVYADLEGNAEITNICKVDPAEYNK